MDTWTPFFGLLRGAPGQVHPGTLDPRPIDGNAQG
jgi:hypothetical protein